MPDDRKEKARRVLGALRGKVSEGASAVGRVLRLGRLSGRKSGSGLRGFGVTRLRSKRR